MEPYRIRLKGPWNYRWLKTLSSIKESGSAEKTDFLTEGTAQMPMSWQNLFGEKEGIAQFERRFQPPTNLEPNEQIAIVFDGIGGSGTVALNGQSLGKIETSEKIQRFDITNYLQPSNLLLVEITCDCDFSFNAPAGLYETVAIEISKE
ncbi:hypothetical protein MNBD_PLANCTO02-329 [hydrothermal vent metagenome]|uniref:Beta-mannosidase-like galactose-binding domain-containing protein n=1 Tax=hydrothermal vent metagenome TaxID=652676 RepID=A0A3B1D040_9ZZZZ